MLSIIDLIRAKTVDMPRAAYLATRVRQGASFIVGAVPGGAGKTTVMGALLNLLPTNTEIVPCDSSSAIQSLKTGSGNRCALAHEISRGSYYCYIWENLLREFFSLTEHGVTVAANLHADNLEQSRDQICRDNSVAEHHFNSIDFFIFLRVSGGLLSRSVTMHEILENDGSGSFREIAPDRPLNADPGEITRWIDLLQKMDRENIHTIEQVRACITGE